MTAALLEMRRTAELGEAVLESRRSLRQSVAGLRGRDDAVLQRFVAEAGALDAGPTVDGGEAAGGGTRGVRRAAAGLRGVW